MPRDYQRVVKVIRAAQEAGRDIDETVMAELAEGDPKAKPAMTEPATAPASAQPPDAEPVGAGARGA